MERYQSKLSEENFYGTVSNLNTATGHDIRPKSKLREFQKYYKENFQPIPDNLYQLHQEKPTFRMLSIHSHNGCNLACRGCNHHSGVLSPGSGLSIDSLLKDLEILLPRINVWSHVSVLGGEALIEPRSKEVLTLLEEFYGDKVFIKIFTNALLLDKNQDWIIEHMKRGTILRVSLHHNPITKLGKKTYGNVYNLISIAEQEGIDLYKTLEISEPWDDMWFDLLKWENNKFYPHEENDIEKSFKYCTAPNLQIYSGKLWKCPSIAYLHETLSSTGQLDDPIWQKYLNYKATPVDAPIEDLFAMADEVLLPHEICNKCPANPSWYQAFRQLKGVKKVSPQKL
jgi:organic radical activating enzyme